MPEIIPKTTKIIADDHVESHPDSSTRRPIFAGYQNYSTDFSERICENWTQWIGGSFVTDKTDPSDIDLVNLIAGDLAITEEQVRPILTFLTIHGSKNRYLVDGYLALIFPEGHPHRNVTLEQVEYWLKWFGTSRDGHDRAIIQNDHPQPEAANEEA